MVTCLRPNGIGHCRIGRPGENDTLDCFMTAATASKESAKISKPRNLPWWTPRCWFGCSMAGWFRLLWRNRFDIDLPCLHVAVSDSLISFVNSGCGALQQLFLGWRVARTPIKEA